MLDNKRIDRSSAAAGILKYRRNSRTRSSWMLSRFECECMKPKMWVQRANLLAFGHPVHACCDSCCSDVPRLSANRPKQPHRIDAARWCCNLEHVLLPSLDPLGYGLLHISKSLVVLHYTCGSFPVSSDIWKTTSISEIWLWNCCNPDAQNSDCRGGCFLLFRIAIPISKICIMATIHYYGYFVCHHDHCYIDGTTATDRGITNGWTAVAIGGGFRNG